MNTVIKYIQLPFAFSVAELEKELNALAAAWVPHFNKAHYEGEWTALPLRSINGSLTNLLPDNNRNDTFMDTVLMDQCPYIKSIVARFNTEHMAVRLLNLKAGAVIKEHTDADLSFEHGEARIHVPITTNAGVAFFLDNEQMDVKPGECWYMNFNLPHRISNNGTTDRVHLVMDIVVNDSIREMFEAVVPEKKKMIPAKEKYTDDERLQIINRLREMNTPASLSLAEKMSAEGC